ncbi:MAG: pullulanase-type alpha-1,6-glucosidase [Acidobacteriota bacterium]|nr:pullulanase-type alpha-1,6-glucosidase [Acidobacteriota bacterium]
MSNRLSHALRFPFFPLALLVAIAVPAAAQIPANRVRVHYHRPDGNYSGWALYTWNASTENNSWCQSEVAATGSDSFGAYFDVGVNPTQGSPAGQLGFIINNCADNQLKDPGLNQYLQVTQYNQAWVISGDPDVFTTQPLIGDGRIPAGDVRIHYHRPDGNYSGWALYTWNASTENNSWCQSEVATTGFDNYGVYFDVSVNATQGTPAGQLGFIINNCANGGAKDPGSNQYLQVTQNNEAWVVSGDSDVFTTQPLLGDGAIPAGDVRVHYYRPDSNYSGWALYTWNASTENNSWCQSEVAVTGFDNFGVYFDISINRAQGTPAGQLGFIINNCTNGGAKDPGSNQYLQVTQYNEAWVLSGDSTVYTAQPSKPTPSGTVRIHYYRPDSKYSGWALYTWNASTENNSWCQSEVAVTGTDSYGVYFDVAVNPAQGSPVGQLGFIINNCSEGGTKDPGPNQYLQVTQYSEAWVISGDSNVFTTQPTAGQIAGAGLYQHQAFWIDRTTIAIPGAERQSGWTYSLVYSLTAGLSISNSGALAGGTALPLTPSAFTPAEAAQYPQLAGYAVFHLAPSAQLSTLKQVLTGQSVVAAADSTGNLKYASGVQDAGVLDDLFYYPGHLGTGFSHGQLSTRVWAPTAQSVKLLLYAHQSDTTPAQTIPMTAENGVWTVRGQTSWKGEYYLYDVTVYVPSLLQIVENIVSDPYSADIALNGAKTRITDLKDESTKPPGWDESSSPYLDSTNDFSVYELHVREFSVADTSVPEDYRGTYLAFTSPTTYGMTHLRRLAKAGLKAVHLMPTFHTGSVNEDKSTWQSPGDLSGYPPDGTEQQVAVTNVQNSDGYDFGYDPVHYFAPNGGYAFNPDNRVLEYRQMVMGLHDAGLRVVQDVVFNHTYAAGQNTFSVLDEIVPGYYYRLDANGNIETASCCLDTASEHRMMEKLMIDNVVHNAVQYKIDGFRFDDMSLHFVYNMRHIQQALAKLTLDDDGVDGSKVYLYGEGFQNPESAALGVNATQENLYGMGIGTFNDRIRDGIRGGSSFSNTAEQVQGFATGLFTDPSAYTTATVGQNLSDQKTNLNLEADWIRIGLAGNLRDFTFVDSAGSTVRGSEVLYNGQPTGYAASPVEAVNYCSVHDNQTLFDAIQLKSALPGTTASGGDTIAMRTRRQVLAMSVIALGQGVPFFFGADDLLRSKDMDYNSYNSGDWFTKINWIYQGDRPSQSLFAEESNNWGIGLPLANVNQSQWPFMQPLLANPALKPTPDNISSAAEAFQTFLRIRGSSQLFHMASLAEVQNNLHFLNTGASQIPGLIVMKLDANGGAYGIYRHVVVVFNATLGTVNFQSDRLKGLNLRLHPLQAISADAQTRASSVNDDTGTVTVNGLTTAVFVAR